jgi:hypothetical protein
MIKLIGITGKARSGKGEAEKLIQKYYGYEVDSFAEPMRKFIIDLLGLRGKEEYEQLKDSPHPALGGKTIRYALQTLGTEWGREMISNSLWVDTLLARSASKNVVISDVRFLNELSAIRDNGGIIIKVVRDFEISESLHQSEEGIPDELVDYIIENTGSIDEYHINLHSVMSSILGE